MPVIGSVAAPTALVDDGMSSATGADRRRRRAAVGREGDRRRRRRVAAGGRDRRAVGGDVDVPGVGRRLLEVVGQRDVLARRVVDGQRGRVVVGRRVGEVDRRAGAGQRDARARVEVHLHADRRRRRRRDAGGRHLQRPRPRRAWITPVRVGRVAHQPLLLVVDDEAVAVDLELAVARVARRVAAVGDLEEAVAVDRQVHRVLGGRDVALRELLRHRGQVTPMPIGCCRRRSARWRTRRRTRRATTLAPSVLALAMLLPITSRFLLDGVQTGKTLLEAHGVLLSCRSRI